MKRPVTRLPSSAQTQVSGLRNDPGAIPEWAKTSRIAMIFSDGHSTHNPVVFANDATFALTGRSAEAIMFRPLGDVLHDITDAATAETIVAALSSGAGGSWDMPCRRADASVFPAAALLTPLRDAGAGLDRNCLFIFELHHQTQALVQQRIDSYALYEQAPGFIALSQGPEHRFIFANASYKRFVGRDNLVSLTVAEALPEIVDQGFIGLLDQVYRTGEALVGRNMPMKIANPASGQIETRYVDFLYQAVRDADNAITGLFCEGYDLTERHEAAHALYALQSEMIYHSRVNTMGTMATMLAHELNQPLSAIANYSAGILRLLDPTVPEAQSVIDAVEAIREASWRAAEIIRNLNEMTKRRKTAQVVFNLKAAVSECTRMVRATVSPSIGIVEDIPEALMLEADRVQIQQVIINLLRNACDAVAVADRQMVSVTAQVEGEKIVVCVGDTGPGVSVEAAQAIFSRIESPKIGGMGLGLSICRSILDAHLGRIWLDNSGSQGARFCFSLPRMPVPVVAG